MEQPHLINHGTFPGPPCIDIEQYRQLNMPSNTTQQATLPSNSTQQTPNNTSQQGTAVNQTLKQTSSAAVESCVSSPLQDNPSPFLVTPPMTPTADTTPHRCRNMSGDGHARHRRLLKRSASCSPHNGNMKTQQRKKSLSREEELKKRAEEDGGGSVTISQHKILTQLLISPNVITDDKILGPRRTSMEVKSSKEKQAKLDSSTTSPTSFIFHPTSSTTTSSVTDDDVFAPRATKPIHINLPSAVQVSYC